MEQSVDDGWIDAILGINLTVQSNCICNRSRVSSER
jgi:hypothetical protein